MKTIYITLVSGLILAALAIAGTCQDDCYVKYKSDLTACKHVHPLAAKRQCQIAAYTQLQACYGLCSP